MEVATWPGVRCRWGQGLGRGGGEGKIVGGAAEGRREEGAAGVEARTAAEGLHPAYFTYFGAIPAILP